MRRGVLPYHRKPRLYAEDDRLMIRVDPAESLFGSSAFSTDHQRFARIVKHALADAELDWYYVHELMRWAVGEDFQAVPLSLWSRRIMRRLSDILNHDYDVEQRPVYAVFRVLAEYWKQHKKPILVTV